MAEIVDAGFGHITKCSRMKDIPFLFRIVGRLFLNAAPRSPEFLN
jgi:hypothetical protein